MLIENAVELRVELDAPRQHDVLVRTVAGIEGLGSDLTPEGGIGRQRLSIAVHCVKSIDGNELRLGNPDAEDVPVAALQLTKIELQETV